MKTFIKYLTHEIGICIDVDKEKFSKDELNQLLNDYFDYLSDIVEDRSNFVGIDEKYLWSIYDENVQSAICMVDGMLQNKNINDSLLTNLKDKNSFLYCDKDYDQEAEENDMMNLTGYDDDSLFEDEFTSEREIDCYNRSIDMNSIMRSSSYE